MIELHLASPVYVIVSMWLHLICWLKAEFKGLFHHSFTAELKGLLYHSFTTPMNWCLSLHCIVIWPSFGRLLFLFATWGSFSSIRFNFIIKVFLCKLIWFGLFLQVGAMKAANELLDFVAYCVKSLCCSTADICKGASALLYEYGRDFLQVDAL